jgi:hypothetical protein
VIIPLLTFWGILVLSIIGIGSQELSGNLFPSLGISFLSTDFGIPKYYTITVVGLIILLGVKEMLLTPREEDRFSVDSIDMGIYPLLICFFANFLFAGLEIIFTQ